MYMKTEWFLLPVKSSLFHISIEEPDPKAKKKAPCRYDAVFFTNVF